MKIRYFIIAALFIYLSGGIIIEATPFLDWKDQKEKRQKFYALRIVLEKDVQNTKDCLGMPDDRYAEILPGRQIVLLMEENFIDYGTVVCKGELNYTIEGCFYIQETQAPDKNYAWMIIQRESFNRFIFFPESYIWWGRTGANVIRITNLGTESLFVDAILGYGMEMKGR